MSMLSVPEGTWSGASGLRAPHLMRGERGSVPASRERLESCVFFECWSAEGDKKSFSPVAKICFFAQVRA